VLCWTNATMFNTESGLPRLLSAKTQFSKNQKVLVWQREIKKWWGRRRICSESMPQCID